MHWTCVYFVLIYLLSSVLVLYLHSEWDFDTFGKVHTLENWR